MFFGVWYSGNWIWNSLVGLIPRVCPISSILTSDGISLYNFPISWIFSWILGFWNIASFFDDGFLPSGYNIDEGGHYNGKDNYLKEEK